MTLTISQIIIAISISAVISTVIVLLLNIIVYNLIMTRQTNILKINKQQLRDIFSKKPIIVISIYSVIGLTLHLFLTYCTILNLIK